MRKLLLFIVLCLPVACIAQNVWEKPETEKVKDKEIIEKEQENKHYENAKYMAGAVPEVDGKVRWTLDIDVPGKSAQEIYDIMLKYMTDLTKQDNQLEGSCVSLVNKQEHIVVASVREWLVFKEQFLALDRTKFYFTLIATCKDGHLNVTMDRISYRYEEGRSNAKGSYYSAEEWITDKNAINKKGTKLYKGSAKFRKKTIDRKDFIFSQITEIVK